MKYNILKSITNENEISAQKGELSLSILPRGTIAGYESYGFEGLSLGDKLTLLLPPVGILGVTFAVFRSRKKRRRAKRRRVVYEDDDHDSPAPPPVRRAAPRPHGVVDLSRR